MKEIDETVYDTDSEDIIYESFSHCQIKISVQSQRIITKERNMYAFFGVVVFLATVILLGIIMLSLGLCKYCFQNDQNEKEEILSDPPKYEDVIMSPPDYAPSESKI